MFSESFWPQTETPQSMTFNPRGRVNKPLSPPTSSQSINNQVCMHPYGVCNGTKIVVLGRSFFVLVPYPHTNGAFLFAPASCFSSTQSANRSPRPSTWAPQWGLTAWPGRRTIRRPNRRHRLPPRPRPRPGPAPQAPPLLPRDPRRLSTAPTAGSPCAPGRTIASTCSFTLVSWPDFSLMC